MIRKLGRVLGITLVWVVVIALLLELLLRLAAPVLPPRLEAGVQRVLTGRPYPTGYSNPWEYSREHYTIVKPNLQDVVQYGSPSVSFRLTTYPLWGSPMGFRIPPEVNYFVDAAFVGDSHTFCFTELADCWVTTLAQAAGMGVVNLGQPVTGSMSHLRILQDYGAPFRPPLVVWQFVGNDFNDDYGLAVLRGELAEIDETPTPPPPQPPARPGWLLWLEQHSALAVTLELLTTGRVGGLTADEMLHDDPYTVVLPGGVLQFGRYIERQVADMSRARNLAGLTLTRGAFQQAQTLVAAPDWTTAGPGAFVVLLVPTRELVYRRWTEPLLGADEWQVWHSAHAAMLDVCDDLALTCFDALPGLQAHAEATGDLLYWTDDPHLNPRGNAVLAGLVRAFLAERGLLPTG